MITKTIVLEFASPKIRAEDYLHEIIEAAKNAERNLYTHHGVVLHIPFERDKRVYIKVDIPDELADKFSPGRHMRGISKYLLRRHGDIFTKYLVGTRLLHYI